VPTYLPQVQRALFATVVIGLVASPASAAVPTTAYSLSKAPLWIQRIEANVSAASNTDGAVTDELLDDQIRFGEPYEHYAHRMRRVHAVSGVESAGQIRLEFDPAYQALKLHAVRIIRDGTAIDAAATATFRTLEEERDRDERIYRGKRTVEIILHDLRVGDVTDIEYTISGRNPVFGGRIFGDFPLAAHRSVKHLRLRILTPASRQIDHRASRVDLQPTTREIGAEREQVWDRNDVAPVTADDDAPSWFQELPEVSLSEFRSWTEVAAWAHPLFEETTPKSKSLDELVEKVSGETPSLELRARKALRLVQDDVRYLGLELGQSTHRPNAPAAVLSQRFGDCKDKARLLVALLRGLGVPARVALVNTELRDHVSERLPSPAAFNHVIVNLELAGRSVWVDGTRTHERGPIGGVPVRFGRALLVAPEVAALSVVEVPTQQAPTTQGYDVFSVEQGQVKLDVTTTYRQEDANRMRRRLSATPHQELQKQYAEAYRRLYKTIEPIGALAIADDDELNVLAVHEHYVIKGEFPTDGFDVTAMTIAGALPKPRDASRSAPIAIDYPLFIRHDIELVGPRRLLLPADTTVRTGVLDFASRGTAEGGVTKLTFELRTLGAEVPAASAEGHAKTIASIENAAMISLAPKAATSDTSDGLPLAFYLCLAGFGVVIIVARRIRDFVRRRTRAKRLAVEAGETAGNPAKVSSEGAAERLLREAPCTCGASLNTAATEIEWTSIRFGGSTVPCARLTCATCGASRKCYFQFSSG